jgi:hypothetical protein
MGNLKKMGDCGYKGTFNQSFFQYEGVLTRVVMMDTDILP